MRNVLAILLLCLFAGAACADDELAVRAKLIEATRRALAASDYTRLEAIHKTLLKDDQRTPSGVWKLPIYYKELKDHARRGTRDPQYWEAAHRMPLNWRKKYPDSVAARLFGASMQLAQVLEWRGNGPGKDLTRAELVQLSISSEAALRLLDESHARALRAGDPEWYHIRLAVTPYSARFSQRELQRILAEGIARYPDYHALYFTAAFYAHARWDGAPDALERITEAAAANSPDLYARIYWYLDQMEYRGTLFERSPADWPAMRASFRAMLAKSPDPWNRNAFAYFACLAKDYAVMQEQMALLDGQRMPEAWNVACTGKEIDPRFDANYEKVRRARLARRYFDYIQYGARMREANNHDAGLAALHEAEAIDRKLGRNSMPVQYHLGWTFQQMGKHAEAVAALTHGLKAQPNYSEALWRRGLSLLALGREAEAKQDFADAATHLRPVLMQALPAQPAAQLAIIEAMRSTLREHGHETPPLR